MSFTNGQVFGAVIGGIIGSMFPPYLLFGMSIGMTVGGIIDPPEGETVRQTGARLGDLSAQTSEWGIPLPRLFGTFKISGNVIWALPLHETKHVEETGEGKGGGGTKTESTWYSYAGSFAVALCEGEISGIKKIWFDSVLVYDGTNYAAGLRYDNHKVYLGTEDQDVDWYIQSNTSDTPAYRGTAYVRFAEIELENYGNKIPKVSCEVVRNGETDSLELTQLDTRYGWQYYSAITSVSNGIVHTVAADFNISYTKGFVRYKTHVNNAVLDSTDNIDVIQQCELSSCRINGEGLVAGYPGINRGLHFSNNYAEGRYIYLYEKDHSCCGVEEPLIQIPCQPHIALLSIQYVDDNVALWYYNHSAASLTFIRNFDTGDYTELRTTQYTNASMNYYDGICYVISGSLTQIEITKYSSSLIEIEHVLIDNPDNFVDMNECVIFVDVHGYHIFANQQYLHIDNFYNISDLVSLSRTVFTSQSWNNKYYYSDGIFYQLEGGGNTYPTDQLTVPIYRTQVNSLSDGGVTVGSIARELLLRAGLESNEIDTSEGTELVFGYVIGTQMSTRDAITSLLSAYQFDLVETDFVIKLRKRTNAAVIATIDDPVEELEIERVQTVELSRMISIAYANKDKNYNAGIQSSNRQDVDAKNVKTYQFAIAMSNDKAKQISEQFLYSEWNERNKYHITLDSRYYHLEPSDLIDVDYEGLTHTIRLTKLEYATDGTLVCEGRHENQSTYISDATGSSVGTEVDEVVILGPARFEILDIPMLDNAYDQESIYIAASGYTEGWRGCAIEKSIDNKTTYTATGNIINSSIIGRAVTVLADGKTTVVDTLNTVTIKLTIGELSSITLEELFDAGNYIIIGNEILQYQTATLDVNDNYVLSNLLRGRRGTEWATDSHEVNERFVLLSTNLILDTTASFNVSAYYRATSFGTFTDDSEVEHITPSVVAKKPFSPSMVTGIRDGSNNLTITWMRRSRDVSGYFTPLALYEETETYEIVIVNADVTTYYTATEEEFEYTNVQQLADRASHVSGDPVAIIIYQISGIVGRGYGTEVIL